MEGVGARVGGVGMPYPVSRSYRNSPVGPFVLEALLQGPLLSCLGHRNVPTAYQLWVLHLHSRTGHSIEPGLKDNMLS